MLHHGWYDGSGWCGVLVWFVASGCGFGWHVRQSWQGGQIAFSRWVCGLPGGLFWLSELIDIFRHRSKASYGDEEVVIALVQILVCEVRCWTFKYLRLKVHSQMVYPVSGGLIVEHFDYYNISANQLLWHHSAIPRPPRYPSPMTNVGKEVATYDTANDWLSLHVIISPSTSKGSSMTHVDMSPYVPFLHVPL